MNRYAQILLEAKSREDIIKAIHFKFDESCKFGEDLVQDVIDIDPTKKLSYTYWIFNHCNTSNDCAIVYKLVNNGTLLKLFDYLQTHNDIQLNSFSSLKEAIKLVQNEDLIFSKSPIEAENNYNIIYKTDSWIIAVPNCYEASERLGMKTKWCTSGAYGNGQSFYDQYLKEGGKYYVNFDLTNEETLQGYTFPYTRYQIHFESLQWRDTSNYQIELSELPSDVQSFYKSIGYDIKVIEDKYFSREDDEENRNDYDAFEEERIQIADNIYLYNGKVYDSDFDLVIMDDDIDYSLCQYTDYFDKQGECTILKATNTETNESSLMLLVEGMYKIFIKDDNTFNIISNGAGDVFIDAQYTRMEHGNALKPFLLVCLDGEAVVSNVYDDKFEIDNDNFIYVTHAREIYLVKTSSNDIDAIEIDVPSNTDFRDREELWNGVIRIGSSVISIYDDLDNYILVAGACDIQPSDVTSRMVFGHADANDGIFCDGQYVYFGLKREERWDIQHPEEQHIYRKPIDGGDVEKIPLANTNDKLEFAESIKKFWTLTNKLNEIHKRDNKPILI